ncbi:mono/diheme cytochrome c family protein [Brevundimonas bullata]|uniref:Mono/diheme cytochrome c family protein n=1 Tax=Brevundimonas bullata TaxID=13160 RepID=A0A7W7INF4_9CAUL|nr:c-type cytochrome [Brevundimonas bullata]MBB4797467.1 mono/diheme cytochrome c family protein [Brevundimonas bullata]MBB6382427.1 mono/diheme cytochrome c family protein [Brevundimonas bullata]
MKLERGGCDHVPTMRTIGALLLSAGLCVALMACADKANAPRPLAQTDAAEGLRLIGHHGCAACHAIPGVRWPQGRTGGDLAGMAARPLIAGRLPNQPAVMAAFVRDAPALLPDTGMPPMPLTDAEARDVAAYLYTLDDD